MVVIGLISGGIATGATPSGASPRWSITPSPSPFGPPSNQLAAVSCPTPWDCFAVGVNADGTATSIERWDGTTWSFIESPTPNDTDEVDLKAIACATATSCFAVGSSARDSSTTFSSTSLIERWDGTRWSIVASPNPSDSSDVELNAVSCASANDCFAVGDYSTSSTSFTLKTLVEHWDGVRWLVVPSANPSGTILTILSGVSCPSSTTCIAVGSYFSRSTEGVFIEQWNGASWSISVGPTPIGPLAASSATPLGLSGVSCSTDTSCFAVGFSTSGTVVEHWNGTGWAVVDTPDPSGVRGAELRAISCATDADCSAVGSSVTETSTNPQGGRDQPLAEHWNGVEWSIVAIPTDAPVSELVGVSCPSPTSCAAVGDSALVERWDGSSWSTAPLASNSSQSQLIAVSCPSATSCFAAGNNGTETRGNTLIEHSNGTTWSIMTSPNPKGSRDARLSGLSCSGPSNCTAVGAADTASGSTHTLIEHWNGTSWSIVSSPNPKGAEDSELTGVSCPTANNCNAVGISFSRTTGIGLAEHWNGNTWSIVPTATPKGTTLVELIGVSCPTTTSCTAVGSSLEISLKKITIKTLIEHWNGKAWSIVVHASPSSAGFVSLIGVSCPTTTNCTAVGVNTSSGGKTGRAMVEHWNGKTWSTVPTPLPARAFDAGLFGVTCRGANSCYAVGSYSTPSANKPLIEHWDGKHWSIVASASPAHATEAALSGIACATRASCIAVGGYLARGGSFTLAERGT